MHQTYLLSVKVSRIEAEAVLDRLDEWFMIGRPDGFFDCDSFNPHVWQDESGQMWACVGFPAADDDMASFIVSLAAQECGLGGCEYLLIETKESRQ